ncbi:hypothetical protein VIN01S_12030 [Vibrio inusitatus NBRC 102082]|uniref:Peptidase C39-like domain-containing protein n=1 Tax=Vibrio inusitatus NBRC 102082 TaxID=1219070 RepID=A0A4Y3HTC3_9VIBR|nr:hypothetical protein [Vibrio inusitatus]GEA50399.1 hypothetical protein VIN01S_12030 [Vibrio inusitatus NBRC 102082]
MSNRKLLTLVLCSMTPFAYALDSSGIEDKRIPIIKTAVTDQNHAFMTQNEELYTSAGKITAEVGPMVNVALITGNESRLLSNCSLNATGLLTRQTTAAVSNDAEALLKSKSDHFWGKHSPTVDKQLVGISNYLAIKAEQMPYELMTPSGSEWQSLDQTNVSSSKAWKEMNQYENGTRYVVAIGLQEDLIRDNSHYIYAEKIDGELVFIDGQTNLASDIPATYLADSFDFSHLNIPKVTTMMFWALTPSDV